MAIYHLSVGIVQRSKGHSPVAFVSYRAGEKIRDEMTGKVYDYRLKKGVIYSEILTPKNVPEWAKSRDTLWNKVNATEKRYDAQTARQVEVALPRELDTKQHIGLMRNFINHNFISRGMIADFSIHDKKDGNPHAHIMITMREVDAKGFGLKNRDWNKESELVKWRENWANEVNRELEKNNIKNKIDHRSYEAQGIEKIPTLHLGVQAHQLEHRGIKTDIGNKNREVHAKNKEIENINKRIVDLNEYKKSLDNDKQKELRGQQNNKTNTYPVFNDHEKLKQTATLPRQPEIKRSNDRINNQEQVRLQPRLQSEPSQVLINQLKDKERPKINPPTAQSLPEISQATGLNNKEIERLQQIKPHHNTMGLNSREQERLRPSITTPSRTDLGRRPNASLNDKERERLNAISLPSHTTGSGLNDREQERLKARGTRSQEEQNKSSVLNDHELARQKGIKPLPSRPEQERIERETPSHER